MEISMPELPTLAFRMAGIDEYIELSIDEVYGFPNDTSYGGGYGAKGTLNICAGEYVVTAQHYFTTGELFCFSIQLRRCYDALNGTAVLENTERELELKCEFTRLGHVIITGIFQANPCVKNILEFEIKTDQTQIKETLASLKRIFDMFGDERGKRI